MIRKTKGHSVTILVLYSKWTDMEKNYSKFKKLNWLLSQSFEAERTYYNASEDVQQIDLKRFLHHQSVNRNRFSYEISEQLVQAGVEPHRDWIQKGNLHRDWRQEKKALTQQKPMKLLQKCRERDEQNLKLYDDILQEKRLPKEALKLLKYQRRVILESLLASERFRTPSQKETLNKGAKVRTLRAI